MTIFRRAKYARLLSSAVLLLSLPASVEGFVRSAQSQSIPSNVVSGLGVLSGTVTDPSGAVIAHADVHIEPHAPSSSPATASETTTDDAGRFTIKLPPSIYDVTISSSGFEAFVSIVTVSERMVRLDAKLAIAASADQVNVPAENAASTSAGDNKSALVFKGDQLDSFSNDDSTFQQEIQSIAGGGGEGGAQVYVDGFSGSRWPPKDSIREVRINQNPFSPQFEGLGFGRVEIFTKPGSEKFHGSFYSSGNDDVFNARNPFTGAQPPYYSVYTRGDLSGPVDKKTSFFASGEYSDQQNNAVVNAFNPDGSSLSEAVPDPQNNSTFSLRLDRQLTTNNTFIGRYEFNKSNQKNSGVGLLVLPSEGIDNTTTTQTLQMGNTQVIGTKLVSETRFQYLRTRVDQNPVDTSPSIIVQGSFNGGGAPGQVLRDNQDQYEFQEYLSLSLGKHFIRTGARYRLLRDSNLSTANYSGEFTFPNLAAYQAKTPSLFSLTVGQPSAVILTGDLGAYAEDEWKARKNVTVTYGLRLESQSAIPDHFDPAPRAGVSWAIGQTDKHQPWVVFRSNAGIFYDRFAAGNILTSVRQNGTSQQSYYVTNPTFYPNIPPLTQFASTLPTPYTISPHLHVSSEIIGGFTVERSIGKIGSVTANYLAIRGVHQYNSQNINAPLPGTYDPANPTSGVRPLGGTQNIYQFASGGIEKAQTFYVSSNLHPLPRLFLFGFYVARHQMSDTFGAASFPSQSYNVSADYGPSGLGFRAVGQRLFLGGNLRLPYGFSSNLFLATQSSARFNITTGTDLNGDTQYNDRPAFATNPGPSSVLYNTRFGNFDANPQPGEATIPYNYGKGPGLVFAAFGLGKDFKFGPRPAAEAPPPGTPPAKGPIPKPDPTYDLSFSVDAANILNRVNAGSPVGVLSSPFFGKSISLNNFFGPGTDSNRTIYIETSFRF